MLFLFSFHFLFSLELFMFFQTCSFLFLALRHFLITNRFYGVVPLYKNIAVFSTIIGAMLKKWVF
jgi:hypothetical protein